MRKLFGVLLSVAAVIAAVSAFAGCSDGVASVSPDAYSFVTIDINPSVELIALGNGVVEVKAANYDACVLLDGEDFSSLTVDEATEKIVALAEATGYLTDTNNQVKISVVSDDAQTAEILKSAAKAGAQKGSKKAVAVTESRLQDELTLKKLKEERPDKFGSLTEEKLRLIESLMEHDPSLTYEAGAEMSVNELASALKTAVKEDKDIFTSELRSEYSARYSEAKREIEREIAAVYGEEYLSDWEEYVALENLYNSIADRLTYEGLTAEDVAEVKQLLGLTDTSVIEKGGIVKAEYVLDYIDKHLNKKGSTISQETVDCVISILNGYSTENYVLTENEIATVVSAAGEEVSFVSLAEFGNYLSSRKAVLEAVQKEAELTDEQVERIRQLKEGFSSVKESVLEDMREIIATARAEITAQKQERGNAD